MQMVQLMKRKVFFFIFTLMQLMAMPVSAQSAAEVWVDKAIEKLQNKGTEITFRINEEGVRISGKLLMEGKKFLYDTEDIKIWSDGTTQWTLQLGSGYNELYINTPTLEEQQLINPYLLLSTCKDRFTIADKGQKNLNGKFTHMIQLQAIDESSELGNINIYIAEDGSISLIEPVMPDDRTYKIEIRSMRNGLTFPKDTFTYQSKEYPADEVIDLR